MSNASFGLQTTCLSKSKKSRQISITAYRAEYERNIKRLKTDKRHKAKRMSTVEPVFGTLINFLGLRKVNTLGQAGAHKCMLMAATAFNLKPAYRRLAGRKLLKYARKPQRLMAKYLEIPIITRKTEISFYSAIIDFITCLVRPSNPTFQMDIL